MYCTSVASFRLPTAMMHRPTVNVANASHVSAVPMATSRPAPSAVHSAAIEVAMALLQNVAVVTIVLCIGGNTQLAYQQKAGGT